MKNDGQCYVWLPTELTFSTLSDTALARVNTVHQALGLATLPPGSNNPYILLLNDFDLGGEAFKREAEPGMACCGPIVNSQFIKLNQAQLIVAFGGDIEGQSLFFELDAADISKPVPAKFPNRLDKQGQPLTWETWGVQGESFKLVKYGTKYYKPSNYAPIGTYLLASQWLAFSSGGGKVLTPAEYNVIVKANSPTLP